MKPNFKEPKEPKDPAYLEAVSKLPCCVCEKHHEFQASWVEVHHTICGRFSQRKTADRKAIPLCDGHHMGKLDTDKLAIHNGKDPWVEKYGLDTDYIETTQKRILG